MTRRERDDRDGSPDALRLFFALCPDPATRSALAALQQQVTGRKVPVENLHLTLAFLGNQASQHMPVLQAILHALTLPAMHLQIDQLGFFTAPRVAWAAPSVVPAALLGLQQALWQALHDAQISLKPVAGFRPHVTLARNAEKPSAVPEAAISWRVGHIALIESVLGQNVRTNGPAYHVRDERFWP